MMASSAGKLTYRRGVNAQNTSNIMGDKSPKSNQKKTTQKVTKAKSTAQVKKQAVAAKQAVGKKK